ncbi:hypothetical protein DES53_12228 [Roseimicrobium gellanilyticum]|uniref:Uncharacterized protein n=1 Tax=Roseimicrobium gellanilyticum TaxID=748857 RepID=A0A366H0J6_9BACT|nr:hypothetical protein [Roseimicrobium gellanilyticum]RBP35361.1 hypothetical protein DES53_12228 [Roseimicrobium gellanilyticum]
MKTIHFAPIIACLLSMCCLTGLTGCASMDSSNQTSLLSAAGFRVKTPQTPKQLEVYAAAPSYKVHRATVDGRTFYAYKDEKNGVAYVGGEAEYQKYQQLATQKKIAQDYYMAAQMNQTMAMNWYGAWGYGGYRYGRPGMFWY